MKRSFPQKDSGKCGEAFFLKAVHAPLSEPRKNTQVHLRAIAIDVFRQLCYEAVRRRTWPASG